VVTQAEFLDVIYNAGERLVPGETHDRLEIVRHKSSYQLFKKIIHADILSEPTMLSRKIRILDVGCGVGHGAFMLAEIIGTEVLGMDTSAESIQYAQENYAAENVQYLNCDVETFLRNTEEFDYVVSRHALEHIEDGLNMVLKIAFRKRLLVNVPFNEPEGNIHHKVHWITESNFEAYPNKEFLYEGLDGVTTISHSHECPPNSIICISSSADLPLAKDYFQFPVPNWRPEYLQNLGIYALEAKSNNRELTLSALDNELNKRNSLLVEKESQLQNHEANLETLAGDLKRRIEWVTEKERQLADHEANLEALAGDLKRRIEWVTEKERQLADHEANLEALAGDLKRRIEWVTQKECQLADHEANLRSLEEGISQRDEVSKVEAAQLLAKHDNLCELGNELSRRETEFQQSLDHFNNLLLVRVCRRLKLLAK